MVEEQKIPIPNHQYDFLIGKSEIPKNHGAKIGKRHIQALLIFLVTFQNYVIRACMAVIVVAMTDSNSTENKDIPIYDWSDKSLIMTAFMWGYMIPQIGAGYLATVFGAKWFLVGSVFFSSFSAFTIPLAAMTLGSKGVIGIRILQGLSQGFMLPSCQALLGKWLPLQERSRLGTLAYLGIPVGSVISMLITGVISSSWYGWPMALYFYGGLGLIITATVAYFCANGPDNHPTITEEETYYIMSNLSENGGESQKEIPVPWSEIFLSLPFWALVAAQAGGSFSGWMLLFETPIYMSHVLKFDLKSNSLLSSLPYITDASFAMIYSFVADYLIVKKICTVTNTRKIMNAWGIIFTAIFLFLLAQCTSDHPYRAVVYLVLIGFTQCSLKSGFNVNHIDLSPNFAGILMGFCNCIGAGTGSLGPLIVHIFVKNEDDPDQWKMVFYISGAIALGCLIFNLIFGSGSVQPWNEGSKKVREKWQPLTVKA